MKSLFQALVLVLFVSGCESIPSGRQGVHSVTIHGAQEMDEYALQACLATRERERFNIDLSRNPSPSCGEAPFDSAHARASLWAWPWTEWPLFDGTVFSRDVERVTRWYRARGFYDARVTEATVDPPEGSDPNEHPEVDITIGVEEGEPIKVSAIQIQGTEDLPIELRVDIEDAILLHVDDRFDEALYDQSKTAIRHALREAGFAKASVEGRVDIDPSAHTASIAYTLLSGRRCTFGDTTVIVDDSSIPGLPIVAAAQLPRGMTFSQSALETAQRSIYSLGTFSSVEIDADLEGDDDVIDVTIRTRVGPLTRFGLGLGVQLGEVVANQFAEAQTTVSQSDFHLLAYYENRNFLGHLQRFRTEIRPRLIFRNQVPFTTDPNFGAIITNEFRRPSFLEARTTLVAGLRYDFGPDVYGRTFNRHLLDAWVGPERTWDRGHLYGSLQVHGMLFSPFRLDWLTPSDNGPAIPEDQHIYGVGFFEQVLRTDWRDDPNHPTAGLFFQIGLQESFAGSWYYFRATPDLRAYIPLPLGLVIAARFAIGFMHIFSTTEDVELADGTPGAGALGPDVYRLRGGGATSNRGFTPGRLGGRAGATMDQDVGGLVGGVRRWEASLELRVPLTQLFGLAFFADAGDVNPNPSFRFYALQLSVGGGIRLNTPVGPFRLDIGMRVPGAQVIGDHEDRPPEASPQNIFGAKLQGAIHLTVGEAF